MSQASMNKVMLLGNLTRDPELKFINENTAVCNIGLALNSYYTDRRTGETRERTDFIEVEIWNKQGEFINQYATKGSPILVEGSLKFESWKSQGESRNRIKVQAQRVQLLSNGNGNRKEEVTTQSPKPTTKPKPTPAPVATTQTPNECPF